jgi:hypothetical protein
MSSNLTLAYELWNIVRENISSIDRDSIAESVVSLLIEHDISPDQIRKAFRGDSDIIEAVNVHADLDTVDEDSEYEDEDEDSIDYKFDDTDDDDEW